MLYRDYRPIEGFEDSYIISNYGEVFSLKGKKSRILKPSPDNKGYLMVSLRKDGKTKTIRIHRLVGNHF
ncbi:MAG: NUMOD4 domain-containing protein, partial [Promethearchaeota archaeon]